MNTNNLKALNKIINNQKLIYSIYVSLKNIYRNKKGRNFKVPLVYQIIITIFKLKYNLPDRVIESLSRISIHIGNLKLPINNNHLEYYVVDTTTIRIGKGKSKSTYP